MNLLKKTKTALKIWQSKGWKGIKIRIANIRRFEKQKRDYQTWIRKYDVLSDKDRQAIKNRIAELPYKPLMSIILPVYNVDEKWLRICLDSVLNQLYPNWELCIADDCSPRPHIRIVLEEYAKKDTRIKVTLRDKNGHISAASNSALELATGEFSILLDHDDELSEHALYFVAEEIIRYPETKMIYSDEDMIDEKGQRYYPKFKPNWSLDLFYSLNLITHLSAYETKLLRKIGGFRQGLEGSQDYDLALRVIEQIDATQIRHIPQILYHWRAIPGSVALNNDEKPYAYARAREAIGQHFERVGVNMQVVATTNNLHRVIYELPDVLPKVCLILFVKNNLISTQQFVNLFIEKVDYANLEFILIQGDETAVEKRTEELFHSQKVVFQGSLSRVEILNYAASLTDSEILCFIEAEMIPTSKDSLSELVRLVIQKKIGAVGGKILFPNMTNRQNGIILGFNQGIGFAFRDYPKETPDNIARTHVINNFSAISGILTVRRELFEELGGFNDINFKQALFDIDFCLRLKEKGYRIIFTPFAEFIQTDESITDQVLQKRHSPELIFLKATWKDSFENDEFYNLNLSLKGEPFLIALPPRIKKPWKM